MTTPFYHEVWEALSQVPKGWVTTYGDLAAYLGRPKATRAVGTACAQNPQLITVPCHRVVTSDGFIGQYAGGVDKKVVLLRQEGIEIKEGRVLEFDKKRFRF